MSFVSADEYLASLATQVPFHNTQFPPVIPHLASILDLCKQEWICKFLFNTDATHLTVLTAPFNLRSAIGCTLAIKRFEPPVMSRPYGFHFDGSMVFIPAHSVDHISVGFGIEEKAYSCTQSFDCDSPRDVATSVPRYIEQFRYVRDDKNGSLIIIYDHGDMIQFEFAIHLNTKCRQRSTSRFDRQQLMDLIEKGSVLDEEKLYQAMMCLQIADEFRLCPTCGAAPDTVCNCSLGLIIPKHSLDFSNHAMQMASHAGSFEGMVRFTRFSRGKSQEQAVLGSRITLQGGNSQQLVSRLSKWVISELLKGLENDPIASIFPPPAQLEEGWDNTPSAPAPVLLQDSPASSAAIELALRSQDVLALRTGGVTVETSKAAITAVTGNQGFSSRLTNNSATVATTSSEAFLYPPATLPQVNQTTQVEDLFVSQALVQPHSQAFQAFNTDVLLDGPSGQRTVEDTAFAGPMTPAQLHQLEKEKERERKRELKKERNRASAQRSNLKKKIENDARKRELQRLRTLETELRAKERRIREENVRLKHQLGSPRSGTSSSSG